MKREKSKYNKILETFKMGDPKGLEALKKKILLDHGIDEQRFSVSSEECANLISEDMAEFQKPKNAQMLPYDEAKWEVPFERLQLQGRYFFQDFFYVQNYIKSIQFQSHWVKDSLVRSLKPK